MIFIHCGGKIGDVEKALGISYPTVKAKLKKLQELLSPQDEKLQATQQSQIMELLVKVESGEMDYEQVMKEINDLKES